MGRSGASYNELAHSYPSQYDMVSHLTLYLHLHESACGLDSSA